MISDSEHFDAVVKEGILSSERRLWIATANVKDLHVPEKGRGSRPLLDHLEMLQRRGVLIRLLHGGKPSAFFLNSLHSNWELHHGDGFEMQQCPRVHCKIVIVDSKLAYTGSANLTGAGLGAKSARRRNFESGVVFSNREHISDIEDYFDRIWMGEYCRECGRREHCPSPFV